MISNVDGLEFSVLGFPVRFRVQEGEEQIPVAEVVDFVHNEADKIKKMGTDLTTEQVAILLSLQLAGEKLSLQKEYRENVASMQQTAADALQFLEEINAKVPN